MKTKFRKPVVSTGNFWAKIVLFACLTALPPGPLISNGHTAVTPNDVYGIFDLAVRKLDGILENSGLSRQQSNPLFEKGLKPMHVYQMAVSVIEAIHAYQLKNKIVPVPIIIATPRKYSPGDVYRLGRMVVDEIDRIAAHHQLNGLDNTFREFTGKTPTHVFDHVVSVYLQISILSGIKQISPNEVFAQMFRAQNDVKSILGKIDPARRYRLDAPKSPPGLTPTDVIKEALKARKTLNATRRHFKLKPVPVPALKPGVKIFPTDVFIQTQIIIAEINIIKLATGTISATPLAIPVKGKKPSDVHQQAVAMEYLLEQIGALEKLVTVMKSR